MKSFKFLEKSVLRSALMTSLLVLTAALLYVGHQHAEERFSYIVQGASKPTLVNAVESVGGEVLHKYTVIQAISALMTDAQVNEVRNAHPMIRLFNDDKVQLSMANERGVAAAEAFANERNTYVSTLTGASQLHQNGITGKGVGVAIIDTGVRHMKSIKQDTTGHKRNLVLHNVLGGTDIKHDENGHGTHVASIIGNSSYSYDRNGNQMAFYNGVAPDADLLVVKAFYEDGSSTYTEILKALDYVISHKDEHNIKVLNLSFSANPQSFYWDDPINQAVTLAWSKGITVLASAGNKGSDAMSIGVPGNNPYVITIGASSDNGTPYFLGDDILSSFSSAGPTVEGFIKPELIAPGSKIQGLMSENSYIYRNFPEADAGGKYMALSGTSQSTAVTSGIVALLLQEDPTLSPDDVKCRLLSSAIAGANSETDEYTYSVFQQGAGFVNAERAVNSDTVGCANRGMNIEQTLTAQTKYQHYVGPARYNLQEGKFYLVGNKEYSWDGTYASGHLWPDDEIGADGHLWPDDEIGAAGHLWPDDEIGADGHLWPDDEIGADGHLWPDDEIGANGHLWPDDEIGANGHLWPDDEIGATYYLWPNDTITAYGYLKLDGKFFTNGHLWPDDEIGADNIWSQQRIENAAITNTWFVE